MYSVLYSISMIFLCFLYKEILTPLVKVSRGGWTRAYFGSSIYTPVQSAISFQGSKGNKLKTGAVQGPHVPE